ncbi:MAG TPA: SWIM zinc finger family protein [Pirellulales bacterium]|jgi:uncharacterized Zn finger protein|nr:SWIM zinc finger family protein [Pirellulales bacterium]
MWWNDRPYVSAAQRRAKAERKLKQLAKQGRQVSPIQIVGRQIAATFWGRAWCDHLEAYSDFSNRLPRGRTYVRNGSVIDLQIQPGHVTAIVSGSDLYDVRVELAPLAKQVWKQVKSQCAGRIGSLVDLLQGKLSQDVMSIVTARDRGLFPKPQEIKMRCSCPDYAYLCKHLAAVLYGIGARLDQQPELLFLLRKVDQLELITAAGERAGTTKLPAKKQAIADDALSEIFGIELESSATEPEEVSGASGKPSTSASAGRAKRSQRTRSQKTASRTGGTRAKKLAGRSPVAKKPTSQTPDEPSQRRSKGTPTSSAKKLATRPRIKMRRPSQA